MQSNSVRSLSRGGDLRKVALFTLVCLWARAALAEPRFWGHLRAGRFGVGSV
jgi:hypothetical protein